MVNDPPQDAFAICIIPYTRGAVNKIAPALQKSFGVRKAGGVHAAGKNPAFRGQAQRLPVPAQAHRPASRVCLYGGAVRIAYFAKVLFSVFCRSAGKIR